MKIKFLTFFIVAASTLGACSEISVMPDPNETQETLEAGVSPSKKLRQAVSEIAYQIELYKFEIKDIKLSQVSSGKVLTIPHYTFTYTPGVKISEDSESFRMISDTSSITSFYVKQGGSSGPDILLPNIHLMGIYYASQDIYKVYIVVGEEKYLVNYDLDELENEIYRFSGSSLVTGVSGDYKALIEVLNNAYNGDVRRPELNIPDDIEVLSFGGLTITMRYL
jgi:hypothetical protein